MVVLSSMIAACPSLKVSTLLGFAFANNTVTGKLNERVGLERWGYLPKAASVREQFFDLVIYGMNIPPAEAAPPPLRAEPIRSRSGVVSSGDPCRIHPV